MEENLHYLFKVFFRTSITICILPAVPVLVKTMSSPAGPPLNLRITAEFTELALFLQFIFSVWSSQ